MMMTTNGDSDRLDAVSDDDLDADGYGDAGFAPIGVPTPIVTPSPAQSGEIPVKVESTESEMVNVRNITKMDVHILIEENGVQRQERIPRLGTFGPVKSSSLTPQAEHLRINKHVEITPQN